MMEGAVAPKGHKSLAQGFNPGFLGIEGLALKVATERRHETLRAPLSWRGLLRTTNPGLKPWAKLSCPFGASADRWSWRQRPSESAHWQGRFTRQRLQGTSTF
jgi:hypothetical protein